MNPPTRLLRTVPVLAALALACALVLPGTAQAQPFGAWLNFSGNGTATGNGYFEVPTSSALNPTDVITIEGWFTTTSPGSLCRSLIGKGYTQTYWIGICPSSGK